MEILVALVLAAVTLRLVIVTGMLNVHRILAAFTDTFGGWRPDPWPRGIQEEDRDRRWGRSAEAADPMPDTPAVSLTTLRPTIRAR